MIDSVLSFLYSVFISGNQQPQSTEMEQLNAQNENSKIDIECTVSCLKSFGQKSHLEIHKKTVHEIIKDYKCVSCEKTFGQKGDLDAHLKLVHEKIQAYKCES